MQIIWQKTVNNVLLNKIEVKIDDVTTTRKWIYNYIMEKKGLLVEEKKNENREKNKNKKRMEEGEKIKEIGSKNVICTQRHTSIVKMFKSQRENANKRAHVI